MNPSLRALLVGAICAVRWWTTTGDARSTAVVWNSDREVRRLEDLFESPHARNVVVFLLADFSLSSLSRRADAFLPHSDGGQLKQLKSVLQRFPNFTVLNEQRFDWEPLRHPSFHHVADEELQNVADWKKHQRLVLSADSWRHLDELVSKVAGDGVMDGRLGVLTAAPSARQKRAVRSDPPPSYSFVNVSDGQCLLYASRISFVVDESKDGKSTLTEYDLPADKLTGSGECGNYAGSIDLKWSPFEVVGKGQMRSVRVGLRFDRAGQQWYLANLTLTAAGSLVKEDKVEHLFDYGQLRWMRAGGAVDFCFACGRPKALLMPRDARAPSRTRYGIAFRDLQLQPFSPEGRRAPGFTTAVDDCAEFFSIPILMGLISVAIVLLITAFGVAMISNLRTMDRFDDPRGKPLVINAKD